MFQQIFQEDIIESTLQVTLCVCSLFTEQNYSYNVFHIINSFCIPNDVDTGCKFQSDANNQGGQGGIE